MIALRPHETKSFPLAVQVMEDILSWIPLLTSRYFHNAHFFDAGEEGGGLEAEEFGGPAGAIDFPVGVL